MNKSIVLLFLTAFLFLHAETLFQVKDSSDRVVLDVSTDGLRVYNEGDLLMVISASEIKAFIDKDTDKALSRSFAVTTASSKVNTNILNITTDATQMREGVLGDRYSDLSPLNMFLGLKTGVNTVQSIAYGGHQLGVDNIFLGNSAGTSNIDGFGNIFIGIESGYSNKWGFSNLFIGNRSGWANEGDNNLFIGDNSGVTNTSGSSNTFVGFHSGFKNLTGFANTAFGKGALWNNSTGSHNTVAGYEAGDSSSSGSYNTVFGSNAKSRGDGSSNSIFGYESGRSSIGSTYNNNSFFGYRSGYSTTSGSNNTYVGYDSGYSNLTGSGSVFLGYNAGYSETSANRLYIANSSTTTPLIKGIFPNTELTFTANRVNVIHPSGSSNGFFIRSTYDNNTNAWHFYQWNDKRLGLFYSGVIKGSWNIDTGAYSTSSDKRLKKNIEPVKPVLDKVGSLAVKEYNFIDQKTSGKYMGLIAQDVKDLFPSLVVHNEETDTYQMDYSGFGVIAIKAIQEQQEEIVKLKNENEKLLGRIEAIEALLNK